ncbi:hypothetical protein K440DRAFT_12730 [Wilcoxina mikolae CBS 423.85]|nr:hypothetical protein K440DRAFT_12730 [Wilcoxina mikolae CBS 423.85]
MNIDLSICLLFCFLAECHALSGFGVFFLRCFVCFCSGNICSLRCRFHFVNDSKNLYWIAHMHIFLTAVRFFILSHSFRLFVPHPLYDNTAPTPHRSVIPIHLMSRTQGTINHIPDPKSLRR